MTKDEGLKLALEALEGVLDNSPKVLDASISGGLYEVVQCRDAITAIKEALDECDADAIIIQYHEATIKILEKRIEELTAQLEQDRKCGLCGEDQPFTGTCGGGKENPTALCFTPPQRPWVGLTEVDILAASKHWRHAEDFMAGVYWASGTLKEKNTCQE